MPIDISVYIIIGMVLGLGACFIFNKDSDLGDHDWDD